MLNCSLLVHTFNPYQFLWTGLINSYRKHWQSDIPLYFGTNTPNHDKINFEPFQVLYSGPGEWSDRLINLLHQIPTDYVLYAQEDHWLIDSPPEIEFLMKLVTKNDIWRLQISPIVRFYSLYGDYMPFYFHEKAKSKYLVAHNPSIWSKKFLLSCLNPKEGPSENEYKGTCRLWQRPEIKGKIAIFPWNWYDHKCENGKFVE